MASSPASGKGFSHFSYMVHSAIFLLITFFFGQLSPIEPLTPYGMKVVGVFLGVIYAWIFIDIIWPSMVGLLAIILLDVMPAGSLLNKSFGDVSVVMILFIFVFSAVLNKYGISKYISLWFVSRKCILHKPWLTTFALLASISTLGGLTSATPAAVIGWGLLYGVFDICGYKKGEGYPIMMFIGSVFAAQLGMALIPFKAVPFVAISTYEKLSGVPIDYASYMAIAITGCVCCLLMFVLVGKYLFRPDVSKLEKLDIAVLLKGETMTLNGTQKMLFGFLIALIVLMMAPSFLPKDLMISAFCKKLGSAGICILLVAILFAIRIEGKELMSFKQAITEGVAWPIIFILCFTLPMAGPLADPKSGITQFMLLAMEPLFSANSTVVFAVCMGVVAAAFTQCINNTAIAAIMMPVIFTYCSAKGVAPELAVILVINTCCLAFLTPAASSTAAMLHGNDWVPTKAIWKIAPILIALSLIILSVVIYLAGSILF